MLHPKCIYVNYKHVGDFEDLSQINPSSVKQDRSPQVRHMHTDNPQVQAPPEPWLGNSICIYMLHATTPGVTHLFSNIQKQPVLFTEG